MHSDELEWGLRMPLFKDDDSSPPAGDAVWAGSGEWIGSAALLGLKAPTWQHGHSSVTKEKVCLHLGRLMPSLSHSISDTALSCNSGTFI